MSRLLVSRWLLILCLFGCGPQIAQVTVIQDAKKPVMGPKQSAEERDGNVPPLLAPVAGRPLVPPKLVPPEPPPDPEPVF